MKYKNRKVVINGKTFDSKKEGNRYTELLLLERAGINTNFTRGTANVATASKMVSGAWKDRAFTKPILCMRRMEKPLLRTQKALKQKIIS